MILLLMNYPFSHRASKKISAHERTPRCIPTFKSVKNFIRLGKNRFHDSSDIEEQCLLNEPGPSSEPEDIYSQTAISSDGLLVDVQSPVETPKTKRK